MENIYEFFHQHTTYSLASAMFFYAEKAYQSHLLKAPVLVPRGCYVTNTLILLICKVSIFGREPLLDLPHHIVFIEYSICLFQYDFIIFIGLTV